MKCRNINLIDQITSIFGENFLENDKRNYLKKALETQDEIDILRNKDVDELKNQQTCRSGGNCRWRDFDAGTSTSKIKPL